MKDNFDVALKLLTKQGINEEFSKPTYDYYDLLSYIISDVKAGMNIDLRDIDKYVCKHFQRVNNVSQSK